MPKLPELKPYDTEELIVRFLYERLFMAEASIKKFYMLRATSPTPTPQEDSKIAEAVRNAARTFTMTDIETDCQRSWMDRGICLSSDTMIRAARRVIFTSISKKHGKRYGILGNMEATRVQGKRYFAYTFDIPIDDLRNTLENWHEFLYMLSHSKLEEEG